MFVRFSDEGQTSRRFGRLLYEIRTAIPKMDSLAFGQKSPKLNVVIFDRATFTQK